MRLPLSLSVALLLAPLLLAPRPAAAELAVEAPACGPVRLVARGVPLREVLQALARELHFELKLEGTAGRTIDQELRKPPRELLAQLTRTDNAVIEDAPDARCPKHPRVTRVWLLPTGGEAPPRAREPTALEQYRKAHGMPPPDEEPPAD